MPGSLFGGFSDPTSYITTDPNKDKTDTYIKAEPIPSRYLGQNFKVPRGKQGRTADTYFGGKFLTLASKEQNTNIKEPDVYEDPGRSERREATKAKAKRIDKDKDFKYVSYPKRSTGPGSIVGTFITKYWEHMPEYKVLARDQSPERPKPQPPNIKTRPGKKGTYGFPGTTLMKLPIEPILDKEKKPISNEYDAMRKQDRAAWEKSKKLCLGGVFKLSGVGKKTFDEIGSVGVSAIYKQEAVKEDDGKKKKKGKGKKEVAPPKPVSDKPFRYSSPAKLGVQGFLGKYPNTRDDPKVPKEDPYDTLRLKRKEDAKKAPKPLGGQWKPVSGPKSAVIRSLLRRFY